MIHGESKVQEGESKGVFVSCVLTMDRYMLLLSNSELIYGITYHLKLSLATV